MNNTEPVAFHVFHGKEKMGRYPIDRKPTLQNSHDGGQKLITVSISHSFAYFLSHILILDKRFV